MKICGIVAEYNPFHAGHAYHCAETRRRLGADTAIAAAMSGNFVQRGDFAILEKYRRAAMAVQCGVDLVVELPLAAALSSAEGFARGAVGVLDAMGCVTHLSFGSECGDLDGLRRAARCSRAAVRRHMDAGHSYAAAMQRTVADEDPAAGALLASPNNTLGIAYCAALDAAGSAIRPLTVRRAGAPHDSAQFHARPSASFLRRAVLDGGLDACRAGMPAAAYAVLAAELARGGAPARAAACSQAMLAHLRRLTPEALLRYAGGSDGLHHRLHAAIRDGTSFAGICQAAQTRRYPLARVRRALLRAYLDVPADDPVQPAYLRVLAIGPRGRAVLRAMRHSARLPVIIKPVQEKRLPDALQAGLRRDALADDLYALAQPAEALWAGGGHYRQSPFVWQGQAPTPV